MSRPPTELQRLALRAVRSSAAVADRAIVEYVARRHPTTPAQGRRALNTCLERGWLTGHHERREITEAGTAALSPIRAGRLPGHSFRYDYVEVDAPTSLSGKTGAAAYLCQCGYRLGWMEAVPAQGELPISAAEARARHRDHKRDVADALMS